MYRHPNIPGIATPIYEAGSIADLLSSNQQIAKDVKESSPVSHITFALDSGRLYSKFFNKEYVFPSSAFVIVPNVRHDDPKNDSKLSKIEFAISCIPWASEVVKITLRDSTGQIDTYLPDEPLRTLAQNFFGGNTGEHIKELDWTADVLLYVTQATGYMKPDILHVSNRHVRGSRREDYATRLIEEAIRAGALGSEIRSGEDAHVK